MSLLSVNGTNLYCETIGDGEPILMMHGGLGLDHTYFRPYFDQLSDQFKVIYYDHRGNGRSDKLEDYSTLTLDLLVDDAAQLLDELGIEKTIVVGHSYGGFLAQLFAAKYPARLSKLVLTNTIPTFDYQPQPNGTDEQLAAFGAAFTRPMESNEDWRTVWTTLSQMYYKAYDPNIANQLDSATHYTYEAWNAGSAALATYNTLEKLSSITAKTLNISGGHDFLCPAERGGARINGLIPASELTIMENSAHFPFIEEENNFFSTLRNWLS
ncbi:MAG: alpha/beta hydrolase [Chloroflexota bacterium]